MLDKPSTGLDPVVRRDILDAAVVLHTIIGGGRTYPGGSPLPEWFAGSTSNSVHATSKMWDFFREHLL